MANIKICKLFIQFCFITLLFCSLSVVAFAKPLTVFVTIAPQKKFVESVAGNLVSVRVLVKSGQSPETFKPSPSQLAKLFRSKILFTIGIPFEKALVRKIKELYPDITIVETDKGIIKRRMASTHHEHTHDTMGFDPHIWLDPVLVKVQANNIAKGIIKKLPDKKQQILENLNKFIIKLDKLTKKISAKLASLKNRIIFTFHPAFGYFTDRFGLRQESIELEGKTPGPRQLAKVIKKCRQNKVKVIFTEKQFSSDVVKTISKAIGGKVISIDPLAENYIDNLAEFAQIIATNLN